MAKFNISNSKVGQISDKGTNVMAGGAQKRGASLRTLIKPAESVEELLGYIAKIERIDISPENYKEVLKPGFRQLFEKAGDLGPLVDAHWSGQMLAGALTEFRQQLFAQAAILRVQSPHYPTVPTMTSDPAADISVALRQWCISAKGARSMEKAESPQMNEAEPVSEIKKPAGTPDTVQADIRALVDVSVESKEQREESSEATGDSKSKVTKILGIPVHGVHETTELRTTKTARVRSRKGRWGLKLGLAVGVVVAVGVIAGILEGRGYAPSAPAAANAAYDPFAPTAAKAEGDRLKHEVLDVRGTWETIGGDAGPNAKALVADHAASLAAELLKLPDDNKELGKLNLAHQIEKHQYAAYAFLMAADTVVSKKDALNYIQQGYDETNKALELMKEAKEQADASKYNQVCFHELLDDHEWDRTYFRFALLKGVERRLVGDAGPSGSEIQAILAKISVEFLTQDGIDIYKNRILKSYVEGWTHP